MNSYTRAHAHTDTHDGPPPEPQTHVPHKLKSNLMPGVGNAQAYAISRNTERATDATGQNEQRRRQTTKKKHDKAESPRPQREMPKHCQIYFIYLFAGCLCVCMYTLVHSMKSQCLWNCAKCASVRVLYLYVM